MDASLNLTLAGDIASAILIGALIGLEREKKMAQEGTIGIGGIRTFLFFSLVGALSAWLSQQVGNLWIFISAFIVVSMFALTGYFIQAKHNLKNVGLTTTMAGIIVYLLGGLVMFGYRDVAVMVAIVTSAVLAFKKPIHSVINRFGDEDIRAGLKLLIATFVVLPLLPNHPVDPWLALNPYKLWLLVILISSLSLIGYVAVRWLGTRKGVALTAFSGGLVSSTAVTLSFSRRSRDESASAGNALSGGIVLAWAVMFVRVLVEVLIVYPHIIQSLWIPYLTMVVIALSASAFFFRGSVGSVEPGTQGVVFQNPFSLIAASKFGLLFAFILLIVKLVEMHSTGAGFYYVAAIAGTTDVDAITLSMSDYAKHGGDAKTAVAAITIASLSNTAVKCFICAILGSSHLRKRIIIATLAILAGGLLSLML